MIFDEVFESGKKTIILLKEQKKYPLHQYSIELFNLIQKKVSFDGQGGTSLIITKEY